MSRSLVSGGATHNTPTSVKNGRGSSQPEQTPESGGSYQSIPSSMETVPTDFVDGYSSGDEEVPEAWGRLFPLGSSFTNFELSNDVYTFGRGENCDVQFNTNAAKKHPCYQAYSKTHFKIIREKLTNGTYVFLQDLSSNGTFINERLVGKGNKQALNNNDEIALALQKNKAFVFMDPNSNEEKNLPAELTEKYTMSKLLGKGACGEVKLAFEKGSCKKFAVKIIAKKQFTVGGKNQVNNVADVAREVNILKTLKHPCVIKIEDVIDSPDVLYIVLELVEGGELFDRVVSEEQFDEMTAKILFYQMVHAIKYLHDQNIAHRDLKPENILLCSPDQTITLVKVTDFGLSKFVDSATMLKTFCGTPNYLAPEVISKQGAGMYTNSVDVWSLGVILFICLVGYPPFSDDRGDMELPKQICGGHVDYPDQYWGSISPEAIDLVKKMLIVDPQKRITLAEALQHTWLKDEEAMSRAHKLMYPDTDGMVPPTGMPKKRKSESSETSSPKKKPEPTAQ